MGPRSHPSPPSGLRLWGHRELKVSELSREMYLPSLGFRWRCVANGSVFPWPPREGDTALPGGPRVAAPTHACPSAGAGWQFQSASRGQACPSVRDVPWVEWSTCFLTKAAAAAQLQEMAAVQQSMGTVLPVLPVT